MLMTLAGKLDEMVCDIACIIIILQMGRNLDILTSWYRIFCQFNAIFC